MSKIETLEQIRMENAWNFVKNNKIDEIEAPAKKLPAIILSSGLGQAVAFYLTKEEMKKIIDNVAKHISAITDFEDVHCGEDLLKKIMRSDNETYILLSKEAIKYSTWIKRLVESKAEGVE